jgi:hypothetical protein
LTPSAPAFEGGLSLEGRCGPLDSFADGVIDAKDEVFARLRIWRDLDQDGITDVGELQTLTEAGITSILLTRTDVRGQNQGHDRGFQGNFTRTNGPTDTLETIDFAIELARHPGGRNHRFLGS